MKNLLLLLLLLSVTAVAMASGDTASIQPIEVKEKHSNWTFNGQAVAYTQTVDRHGDAHLFSNDTTYGALGLQLKADNKDLFYGLGVGVEVSAIGQTEAYSDIPDTPNSFVFPFVQGGDAQVQSATITQAYITYDLGRTSFKIGRQTLSKSISPFVYTENWQMFKNTVDTALIINKDIPDTSLIYALIGKANSSIGRLDNFDYVNYNSTLTHMFTVQNKSIQNLQMTGTYYYAPNADFTVAGDLHTVWGDVKYKNSGFLLAIQGGRIFGEGLHKETNALGVMAGAAIGIINLSVAYSSVNDGDVRITNYASVQRPAPAVGIKSPLYTQMVLDNIGNHQAINSDWVKIAISAKALGGKLSLAVGGAFDNNSPEKGQTGSAFGRNPYELDLVYKTKVKQDITLFAAYVYTSRDHTLTDGSNESGNNFVRFWARYHF